MSYVLPENRMPDGHDAIIMNVSVGLTPAEAKVFNDLVNLVRGSGSQLPAPAECITLSMLLDLGLAEFARRAELFDTDVPF
jgi:hypothetical protein